MRIHLYLFFNMKKGAAAAAAVSTSLRNAVKAVALDTCYSFFVSLFWDTASLERITSGWVQSAPPKVDTLTGFVHLLVDSIAHGELRFSMDHTGMYFFRETALRITYDLLTPEQRATVFYIYRQRRHVFMQERGVSDNTFWLGRTHVDLKRLDRLINRPGIVSHLIRHLLRYEDGALRHKLYLAFSSLCCHKGLSTAPFVSQICYALGHPRYSLEEFDLLPLGTPPDEVLSLYSENACRTQNLELSQGSRVPGIAPIRPRSKKQPKSKRLDQHAVDVNEWTGEEVSKLPSFNPPLNLSVW